MSLDIDQRQLDPEDFSGAKKRSVDMNNEILEKVREQNDVFCTYMAEVRWLVLQLTRDEFAEAAKIDETAVRGMERTGSITSNSTLHRVFTHLRAIEDRYRPFDLANDFLDVTVRERYGASRRMHAPETALETEEQAPLSVSQVYSRWAIMKTLAKVEDTTGIKSGGIWQREAMGVLPDYVEISKAHKKLRLPNSELDLAQRSWTNDRGNQLRGRDLPPALADFLTRLEAKGLPSFTAASVRSALGCTFEHAELLHSGQMVSFEIIASTASKLYRSDEIMSFVECWETQYLEDQQLPRFGSSFIRIRDQINITNRELAIAMDIRAPENRGKSKAKKRDRSEPFRPSHLIRDTLENVGNSAIAPAGVLVGLVSHAASVSDEVIPDPADELRGTFNDHRSRLLRRSGATMHSSPLRLSRDFWGVEREELALTLGCTVEDVLVMEKSEKSVPSRVLTALEKLGETKLEPSRNRWIERNGLPEPTTVQNLFVHLTRKAGSVLALQRLLSTNKYDSKRGTSSPALVGISQGTVVPPWPMIQRFTGMSGLIEFPKPDAKPAKGEAHNSHEKLWRDWSVKFSDALFDHGKTAILARALHHLYGQKAESLRDFIPSMSVSYPTQTRVMQRLEVEDTVDWTQISRTLDAAGLSIKSAQYVFIKALHETGSIEEALVRARNAVRTDKAFEHESYGFGLTTQERGEHNLP